MLSPETIESAVKRLVKTAHSPLKVILFGSCAKGTAGPDSDLYLLVVEADIPSLPEEYNRLRGAIGAIGVGVDVLIYQRDEFESRTSWRISPVYDAVRSGKVMYERSA